MMINVYNVEQAAAVDHGRWLQEAQERQQVRQVPPCMTTSSRSLLADYQQVPRRALHWFSNAWTAFLRIWQGRLEHPQAVEHNVSHRQALQRRASCGRLWLQP